MGEDDTDVESLKGSVADLETQLRQHRRENERFRRMIETAPSGILVADESGRIVYTNQMAETLFGYSKDEFSQLKVEDLVPEKARRNHKTYRSEYQQKPEVRQMGSGRELYAVKKDGTEFPVEIGLTPLPGEDHMNFLASVVDISRRKENEITRRNYATELERTNTELQVFAEILKNVHDAVFYVDEDGMILNWNNGAVRIFETPAEDAVGHSILRVCPHDEPHPFFDRLIPSAEDSEEDIVIPCCLKSGREVIIRAKVTKMSLEGKDGYVICASDITRQRKLESEILRISENEQQRIGQDIHDDLCSQLSGIGMLTKVLENQLRENHKKEAELMAQVSGMVADAGQKARHLARGLAPTALETQGLSGAIHEMADRSKSLFGVDCVATVLGSKTVDSLETMIGAQLLRIAQEATTNAMKHSDAELVQIRLNGENGRVSLEITDDGKGIPDDIISNGMGMMTMRKRAEMINADFELHSFAGKGTRITCSLRTPENCDV